MNFKNSSDIQLQRKKSTSNRAEKLKEYISSKLERGTKMKPKKRKGGRVLSRMKSIYVCDYLLLDGEI